MRAYQSPTTREIVAGNTEFAVDLYGKLRTREGNVCFSPYSISTALAMTYGGARGETEKQMAQTLHFNLPPDKLHPAFAALEANSQGGAEERPGPSSQWPTRSGRKRALRSCRTILPCARNITAHPSNRLITRSTLKPRAKRSMIGSRPGPTGKLSNC